jgi:hypothetical protein
LQVARFSAAVLLKIQVFWDFTLVALESYSLEEEETTFFRNTDCHTFNDTASFLRRPEPSLQIEFTETVDDLYNPELILRRNEDSKETQL